MTGVTNEELLELPCDVLVLAAREDQIHADNAARLQARLIAEGANGPTSLEADAILAERGILVLPDVLTNAGGVTVSYFEWVQDLGRLFWDRRRDPRQARRPARRRVRPGLDDRASGRACRCAAPRSWPGSAKSRRARVAGDLSVSRVRDAMIPDPVALDASATAQEAGRHLVQPDVRAVSSATASGSSGW